MSTTGYTSAVPQESVWGFNPCGIFCGITMYHTSTTALLCGILWYIFFSVVFPMVFLVPHEYHRLHFCSTTGLCVVLHYPCGIFCGIMQYHRNTTGIPHDIFVRELDPGRKWVRFRARIMCVQAHTSFVSPPPLNENPGSAPVILQRILS